MACSAGWVGCCWAVSGAVGGGAAWVLALLLGFYAGENITALWLERVGQRPVVVLLLVVLLELVVRLRTRLVGERPGLGWILIDNLRLGVVYAVVLEAFKLGS